MANQVERGRAAMSKTPGYAVLPSGHEQRRHLRILSTGPGMKPRHRWRSLLVALMLAVTMDLPVAGQTDHEVDIRSAVKVFVGTDTPALRVVYRYDFRDRQTVYINGLGMVPAHGEFEYLTREPSLQVRDAPGGALLAEVPLKETIVVAARAPLNRVPAEKDFPPDFRSDAWTSQHSLQERLNVVLRNYFSYMPHDDSKVSSLATTFTPLQVDKLPLGSTAQIALLISFPHDVTAGKYWFRVHSLLEEGRTLSNETRPTSNEIIQKAGAKFVDQLINEIRAAAQSRP